MKYKDLVEEDKVVYLLDLLFFIEGLSSSQKLLLLFLGSHSYGFYSLKHLSDVCGVSKVTTIKNLKFLEWLNWIEITKRRNEFNGNDVSKYSLKIENIKKTLQFCEEQNVKLDFLEKEFKDLKNK